jgi:hypothetical protein
MIFTGAAALAQADITVQIAMIPQTSRGEEIRDPKPEGRKRLEIRSPKSEAAARPEAGERRLSVHGGILAESFGLGVHTA